MGAHRDQCYCAVWVCFLGKCCIGNNNVHLTFKNGIFTGTITIPGCGTVTVTLKRVGCAWTITWSCGSGQASYTFTPAETQQTAKQLILGTSVANDNGSGCCSSGAVLKIEVSSVGPPCGGCAWCDGSVPTSFQLDISGVAGAVNANPFCDSDFCAPAFNGTFIATGPFLIPYQGPKETTYICTWYYQQLVADWVAKGLVLPPAIGVCRYALSIYLDQLTNDWVIEVGIESFLGGCTGLCTIGFSVEIPNKPVCPSLSSFPLPGAPYRFPCCCDSSGGTCLVTALP